jgi:hypothetical protein
LAGTGCVLVSVRNPFEFWVVTPRHGLLLTRLREQRRPSRDEWDAADSAGWIASKGRLGFGGPPEPGRASMFRGLFANHYWFTGH